MKQFGVLLLVVGVLLATQFGLANAGKSKKKLIEGSGNVVSETRTVGAFTRIDAGSMLDLVVSVGEKQSIVIYLDDNLLPLISTEVEDGWLVIENEKHWKTESNGRIEISVPALEEIEANGLGDIVVRGLDCEEFTLEQNGTGDVELTGRADELDIVLNGMGDVDAHEVETQIAGVRVNGMGDVHVRASERLRGSVNGMGDVFSYGKPEYVSVNVSGMGSLIEK